ncbi:MAG: ATPase, partial [Prevotella sp.]|nr:ATPase [Prevotella sp.]
MMTIIADSGSTKTDWTIIGENSAPTYIHTQGINPVLMSKEEIETILRKELIEQLPPHTSHLETRNSNLFFYGAGVREEQIPKMQEAFHSSFHIPQSSFHIPHSTFHVDFTFSSDLLAAARAVCGHNEGIACILGTGANSCLYDGVRIVQNTPALGFI